MLSSSARGVSARPCSAKAAARRSATTCKATNKFAGAPPPALAAQQGRARRHARGQEPRGAARTRRASADDDRGSRAANAPAPARPSPVRRGAGPHRGAQRRCAPAAEAPARPAPAPFPPVHSVTRPPRRPETADGAGQGPAGDRRVERHLRQAAGLHWCAARPAPSPSATADPSPADARPPHAQAWPTRRTTAARTASCC